MSRDQGTLRLTGLLVGLALAVSACAAPEPTVRERCESALDHTVDLRIRLLGDPALGTSELRAEFEKHRETLKNSLGEAYLEQCKQRGERFARCVLHTATTDGLRKCQPATTAANSATPRAQETDR